MWLEDDNQVIFGIGPSVLDPCLVVNIVSSTSHFLLVVGLRVYGKCSIYKVPSREEIMGAFIVAKYDLFRYSTTFNFGWFLF